MPRRARFIVPGVAHHVTQRGNNRQQVFYSLDHRRLYLDLLIRHARRYGTQIVGYCLMTNHVHLVVIPEHENSLARSFGRTHAEYALALNQSEKRSGHLWQNRFFSCPLDASHLENAIRYVELNPVRAGLIVMPWDWPWSSARAHSKEGASDALLESSGRFEAWDCAGWKESLLSCDLKESVIQFGVRHRRASHWDRASSSGNSNGRRGEDSRCWPVGAPRNG